MPKIIQNKQLIVNAYNNRKKYGLTIKQIAEIFEVDPKTINNYTHKSEEFINTKSVCRSSFIDELSDEFIQYIINNITIHFLMLKHLNITLK